MTSQSKVTPSDADITDYSKISALSIHKPINYRLIEKKKRMKAFMTVLGGFLYMSFLGCQYVVGTISPYLASYYGVGSTDAAFILPLIFITNIFVMPIGGQLAQRVHPKILLAAGLCIFTPMTLISTQATTFALFLPMFSCGFGLCNGLTYMVPMQHGWLWFPDYPGLVSGIIIGGFGIGQFTFSLICANIVNPDGEQAVDGRFSDDVNERVPQMQLFLAICNITVAFIAMLLIFPGHDQSSVKEVCNTLEKTFQNEKVRERRDEIAKHSALTTKNTPRHSYQKQQRPKVSMPRQPRIRTQSQECNSFVGPDHFAAKCQQAAPLMSNSNPTSKMTQVQFIDVQNPGQVKDDIDLDNVVLTDRQKLRLTAQCIKTSLFWYIYAMQFSSILLGYYIVNSFKSFGQTVSTLNDDEFLTLVSSISALFNAARFVWSGALDRLNFKKVYGFLLVLQILLALSIRLTEKSRVTFGAMVCLVLFCIGGHFALFPNLLKQIYGKQATVLYGVLFTGTGLASLFIVGLVLSPYGQSYYLLFYLFGALSLCSLVILTFFFKQARFEPDWQAIFLSDAEYQEEFDIFSNEDFDYRMIGSIDAKVGHIFSRSSSGIQSESILEIDDDQKSNTTATLDITEETQQIGSSSFNASNLIK